MANSETRPMILDSALDEPGLTTEEDNELRQLTWFSLVGHLSDGSQARLLELRAKDRRRKVRNPRPDPSASRMSIPDSPAPSREMASEQEVSPAYFTCPNCGFVQRGLGLTSPTGR